MSTEASWHIVLCIGLVRGGNWAIIWETMGSGCGGGFDAGRGMAIWICIFVNGETRGRRGGEKRAFIENDGGFSLFRLCRVRLGVGYGMGVVRLGGL